jgi:hypothetical protein
MNTYAPSSTNSLAVANAMPEVAPVMTATLRSSLPMVRLLNLDFVDACASMVCTCHWRDAIKHIDTKFSYGKQSQGTITKGNETTGFP